MSNSPVSSSPEIKASKEALQHMELLFQKGSYEEGTKILKKMVFHNIDNNTLLAKLADTHLLNTQDPKHEQHLKQADVIYSILSMRDENNITYKSKKLEIAARKNDFDNVKENAQELTQTREGKEELRRLADAFAKKGELKGLAKGLFIYKILGEEFPYNHLLEQSGSLKNLADLDLTDLPYELNALFADSSLYEEDSLSQSASSHRVKGKMTRELELLQENIDEKNYPIRLDVNPYIPARSNKPDPEKAMSWIQEHPLECQAAAHEIIAHTNHVPFNTFKDRLKESVEDFNQSLKTGEKYIVAVRENKSNKWILELSLPYLKELPYNVVDIQDLSHYLTTHSEVPKVVFMDDASYSGEQMSLFIHDNVPTTSQPEVCIIVPFLTHFAERNIGKSAQNVKIMKHQVMKTIAEEITNPEILSTIHQMYFQVSRHETKDQGVKSHTLTIFDHKVADYLSTLEDVYKNDAIRDLNGASIPRSPRRLIFPNATRFVKPTEECYKNI